MPIIAYSSHCQTNMILCIGGSSFNSEKNSFVPHFSLFAPKTKKYYLPFLCLNLMPFVLCRLVKFKYSDFFAEISFSNILSYPSWIIKACYMYHEIKINYTHISCKKEAVFKLLSLYCRYKSLSVNILCFKINISRRYIFNQKTAL